MCLTPPVRVVASPRGFNVLWIFTQRGRGFSLCSLNRVGLAKSLHNTIVQSQLSTIPRSSNDINYNTPGSSKLLTQARLHSQLRLLSYNIKNSQLLPEINCKTPITTHPTTITAQTSLSTSHRKMSSLNIFTDTTNSPVMLTPATTPSSTPAFALELAKHNLTKKDLQDVHDIFVKIAKDAGEVMETAEHDFLVAAATKNNTSDLVTKYDKQIEAMVEQRLRAAYPEFDFLGEESYVHGKTVLADKPTFVIDPIDGTLNFSKGVPNCAISLGFTINKKPVVGVVYNPFRGDLYSAIKTKGAYLTKVATGAKFQLPLQPVPPPMPSLNSCLIAVEWGNERKGANWALRTDIHKKLLTSKDEGGAMCKSVRSNGSAALDFCYVAHGMLDAFWEGGVWVWDVCAGWIILQEAGGIVASANPGNWDPTLEGRLYFAVRGAKREEQMAVVQELWSIMGDRKFEWK
jgi:myo-inositol-1(or 4)-monophosphatase